MIISTGMYQNKLLFYKFFLDPQSLNFLILVWVWKPVLFYTYPVVHWTLKYKYKKKATLSQYFDLATEAPLPLCLEAGRAQRREPQTGQWGGSPGSSPHASNTMTCPWRHPWTRYLMPSFHGQPMLLNHEGTIQEGSSLQEQLCRNWSVGSKSKRHETPL